MALVDNNIVKSHIFYQFGNSDILKVNKKGSDLKEAFKKLCNHAEEEKMKIYSELVALKSECGEDPTEDVPSYWYLDGFDNLLKDIPKVYDWKKIYPNSGYDGPQKEEGSDKCKCMDKYNEKVREYINYCIECLQIKTIINNLEDAKSYQLNANQATLLGF